MTGHRGSILLATLVLGLAAVSVTAALAVAAREGAMLLAARRDALCARYAALAGLALGRNDDDVIARVDERIVELTVRVFERRPGWCVVTSRAVCGAALRSIERTLADSSACDGLRFR